MLKCVACCVLMITIFYLPAVFTETQICFRAWTCYIIKIYRSSSSAEIPNIMTCSPETDYWRMSEIKQECTPSILILKFINQWFLISLFMTHKLVSLSSQVDKTTCYINHIGTQLHVCIFRSLQQRWHLSRKEY